MNTSTSPHKKNKSKIKKTIRAYTLIELLLVIALISIITSLGIMTFRNQTETSRINKAALEVQQILEAALAYNNDNATWPDNNNNLTTCDPTTDPNLTPFIQNYLPNGNYKSNYGDNYCWSAAGSTTNPELFWVAINVPNHNVNMANRIAARLPNAIVTSNPNLSPPPDCDDTNCYVRAEVTLASASKSNNSIVGAGDCKTGETITENGICTDTSPPGSQTYQIKFKACPSATTPQITLNPNYIHIPHSDIGGRPIFTLNASTLANSCTTQPDGAGNEICNISVLTTVCIGTDCHEVDIKTLGNDATEGASYIVTCTPQSNGAIHES